MRKFFYPFLIVLVMWGIVVFTPTYGSIARTASRSALRLPTITSMRIGVTPTIPRSSNTPQALTNHTHAHRSSLVIALTFDDGPSPLFTPQVLTILRLYRVQATFFCIGEWARLYPRLVAQTFRAGNAIGNHTWSHPVLTRLSPYAVQWQLHMASVAIQYATGTPPLLFRPPYGATNAAVVSAASQLGLLQILWTIDPRDWSRPGISAIVNVVLSHATNRSIILLHDGGGDRSQTIRALPLIITVLLQRGFTFVTVPQLLGR